MQAVVNPGEAKQIEQDYAHTILASSEMTAATAQSTAEVVQAFIQMLRERLQAAQIDEPGLPKAWGYRADGSLEGGVAIVPYYYCSTRGVNGSS